MVLARFFLEKEEGKKKERRADQAGHHVSELYHICNKEESELPFPEKKEKSIRACYFQWI